jgi:uncharacterized protein YbbK (DUF523 family)
VSEQNHVGVLVSACLLGRPVRYDGGHSAADSDVLARWRREERLAIFCPEVAGGLATPRAPAEIVGGDGEDVLDANARVVTDQNTDVTDAFLLGARTALKAAVDAGARLAVLKSKSPSCGSKSIYDGTFSGVRTPGQGVTAALLRQNDIRVFTEHELADADAYLRRLEAERA